MDFLDFWGAVWHESGQIVCLQRGRVADGTEGDSQRCRRRWDDDRQHSTSYLLAYMGGPQPG